MTDTAEDIFDRQRAELVEKHKGRAWPTRVALGLCVLLFLAVGLLFLKEQHDQAAALKDRTAALLQIKQLNDNKLALLKELRNPHLSKAQVAQVAAELSTLSTQTAKVAQQGAPGAPGPAGPIGPAGLNGTNGAVGAGGANGAKGTNGANGAVGSAGANGLGGTNGVDGATGLTGATGATGADGIAGPQGATGATGATGAVAPNPCPMYVDDPRYPGFQICLRPSPTPAPVP